MNAFLASLPVGERARIHALTAAATEWLRAWAAPFGVFDPRRFAPTALTMVAAAPWLPEADLWVMSAIPAWIFTIDACLDEGVFRPEERRTRAAHYVAIAAAAPGLGPEPRDPYAAALADLQRRLAERRLGEPLRPYWAHACRRMLAGMIAECEAGDRGEMPDWNTYLRRGLHSIGVPMYLAGAYVLTDDPGLPGGLSALLPMVAESGRAVRLANDLRTADKERAEGNCNALFFAGEEEVRSRCLAAVERMLAAGRRVGPDSPAAVLTERVTRFAVDFYAEHDYHTLADGELERL